MQANSGLLACAIKQLIGCRSLTIHRVESALPLESVYGHTVPAAILIASPDFSF
jgi:hypothetical protein